LVDCSRKIVNCRKIDTILSTVFATLVASFLWILKPVALPDVTAANEQLTLERGGLRIQQARVVVDFVQRLQAYVPPTRSILALPYQPIFYFLCERRNPTCWNYLWPGDQSSRDYERLIPEIVGSVPAHYIHTDDLGNLAIYVRRETD
jgi:hypothetical protein